jgi:hypothetical protein
MAWENFEAWCAGDAMCLRDAQVMTCQFTIGSVSTGKQRVFHCFYVNVELPNGFRVTGKDQHSVRAALRMAGNLLELRGFRLMAAGLEPEFYESGLSYNSTKGFWDGRSGSIHMMDLPPTQE